MEARTSSPRRLQIVVQKKKERKAKEEEWEQPKRNPAATKFLGNSRHEVFVGH